ncbi:MAG: AAA family ATPase [Acutalibacteraceae bacterium]|nr:AAA family ATPase [Acutalibacteraceae bacterium]
MAEKIVIASGKGGVGKTSLTVGIGKALSAMGKKVLIIDCDILRSVDLLTGVTEKLLYDWGDVIFGRCNPEDAVYVSSDVSVITCPPDYDGVTEGRMKKLLQNYEDDFDYIFIDAPAGIDRGLTVSCAAADRGIVVSTPDLVCVRSACVAGAQMNKLGVEDVRLIINRVMKKDIKKGRLLNIDSVIDSTQIQLIGVVPEDAKIRLSAMGKSIYRKGQVSYIPFGNIAKRIDGDYIALKL